MDIRFHWPYEGRFDQEQEPIDVYVRLDDGQTYVGTFATPNAIRTLLGRVETGYICLEDTIITGDIEPENIKRIIDLMIKRSEFEKHFVKENQ